MLERQERIENYFGDFLYAIANDVTRLKSIRFKSPKEMYITIDETEIHIRERTPEKMYTRAIFEVLHKT